MHRLLTFLILIGYVVLSSNPTSAQSRKQVLCIQDNPFEALAFQKAVKQEGHVFILADDALTAVQLMENRTPDLIFTDVSLPGMSSKRFASKLNRHASWDAVPVIATGAWYEPDAADKLRMQGFDEYLSNPIEKKEIVRLMRKYLN